LVFLSLRKFTVRVLAFNSLRIKCKDRWIT